MPAPSRRLAVLVTVVAAVVVAVMLVLLGGRSASFGAAGPSLGPGGPAHAGTAPPEFSAATLDGGHFDLAGTRGQVVIVNFFATWCDNCRAELPLLEQRYQQLHGRGLQIVTVDYNDQGDAAAFVRPYGLTFPVVLDPQSRVGTAYGIQDLPVSVFIRRDGTVAQVFHGQLSDETFSAAVQPLL